jgi:hypothetical protein
MATPTNPTPTAPTSTQEFTVTQSDIDGLATKLDQFGTILTPKETMIMLGALEYAGQAIKATTAATPSGPDPTPTQPKTGLPRLSDGFRNAFKTGVGSTFDFEVGQTEDVSGSGQVGGSVTWTKKPK